MKFKPENTAVSRKRISAPLEYLLGRKYFVDKKYHRVFDYGCGRGKDYTWLKKNGYKAVGWDRHHKSMAKPGPDERFDVVFLSYVLDIIPTIEERLEALVDAWSYVAPGGFLLVSARPEHEVKSEAKKGKWGKIGDGFVSSREHQTFQCGFTGDRLAAIVKLYLKEIGYVECSKEKPDFAYVLISRQSAGE